MIEPGNHLDGLQEMLDILMRMEADKVSSEQPFYDLLFPACMQESENLKRRKWNMKKESNFNFGSSFANHTRKQHQLVIMDPKRVVRLKECNELFCKDAVHLFVCLKRCFVKFHHRRKVVKQWQQR